MLTFAVAPNCTCSYILHHFTLAVKIMKAILFKNVLYEEVKKLRLLNIFEYLSFYGLCGKIESTQKTLPQHTKAWWLSQGKTLVGLFQLLAELATLFYFFMKHNFYLTMWLTGELWYSHRVLADIFLKDWQREPVSSR